MKMLKIIFLAKLCLLAANFTFAQNIEYVGSYDTPGEAKSVFVSGSYAYVADGPSGLQIVDISDPSNPAFAGNCATPVSAERVFISGDYAYVAAYDLQGSLQIIDITDPANPIPVGIYMANEYQTYCVDAFVSGAYAYTTWWHDHFPRISHDIHMKIIDVSEPINPFLVEYWELNYNGYQGIADIAIEGNHAFFVWQSMDGTGGDIYWGFEIFDISDPSNPMLVGSSDTPWPPRNIYILNDYAYISWAGENQSGLGIMDISDFSDITLVGNYDDGGDSLSFCTDVFVSGDYAQVAGGWEGSLQIIDVSDPSDPAPVINYDTPGDPFGVYVEGDYTYVADMSSLMILRFNPQTKIEDDEELPDNFMISQNYPNPFNASTVIRYELPKQSHVTIDIYDILGRKVTTLVDRRQPAGYYQAIWKTDDFTSGLYFYKLQAGEFTDKKKMLLMK